MNTFQKVIITQDTRPNLTLLKPTRENLVLDPQAAQHLNKRACDKRTIINK